ncbi:MAG: hypothetical protein Q8K82_00410, partial [Gemmatimonadaceae bacterium]|nr:hypothetical protein [Gemmatimonadaceae bacterium]
NSSILFDRKHGGYSSGNQETQDRLVALGLLDLVRVFSPPFDSTATFLTPGQRHARHQLDYMYATARIRDAARSCGIGPQDWEASDHLPIVAEFDGASGEPPLPRA